MVWTLTTLLMLSGRYLEIIPRKTKSAIYKWKTHFKEGQDGVENDERIRRNINISLWRTLSEKLMMKKLSALLGTKTVVLSYIQEYWFSLKILNKWHQNLKVANCNWWSNLALAVQSRKQRSSYGYQKAERFQLTQKQAGQGEKLWRQGFRMLKVFC